MKFSTYQFGQTSKEQQFDLFMGQVTGPSVEHQELGFKQTGFFIYVSSLSKSLTNSAVEPPRSKDLYVTFLFSHFYVQLMDTH